MYRISNRYLQQKGRREVLLNPNQIAKMRDAEPRKERRLNRKWPWREQLVTDLGQISLSSRGKDAALTLLQAGAKECSAKSILRFLSREEPLQATADYSGTIRTNLSSCPRELKPHLLFGEEPVVICDISHAHHCFLPKMLKDRIDYLSGNVDTAQMAAELAELREFLSTGDYYRKWCVDSSDDQERQEKKDLLTILLNQPNKKTDGNRLYRRMRSRFPHTFRILEDIKRKNHRTASVQLRNYTARAVNSALLRLQDKGIPVVPNTDDIICPAEAKAIACEDLGREVHYLTGVCCKVGGIRYKAR